MSHLFSRRTLPLVLALTLCAGCAGTPSAVPTVPHLDSASVPIGTREQLCLSFVQNSLTDEHGGIYTNYLPQSALQAPAQDWATGHEILSESQGLMLRYCVQIGDAAGFSRASTVVDSMLDTKELLSYRLGEDAVPYPVNAAVDDLRIIRALLEGAQLFVQPSFATTALSYADRLYQTNVQKKLMLDFYASNQKAAGRIVTLCYADFFTLRLLGTTDTRWQSVEKAMYTVVENGFLGEQFPFYETHYLPDTKAYETDRLNMAETLVTVLHLAEIGACPQQTLDWLNAAVQSGSLYGQYQRDGTPAVQYQSTAVYALCVQIAVAVGHDALLQGAMQRMLALQVMDEQSELYGSFADSATSSAYSYDNLHALLAFRAYAKWEATA